MSVWEYVAVNGFTGAAVVLAAALLVVLASAVAWVVVPRHRWLLLVAVAGFVGLAGFAALDAWPGWVPGVCLVAALVLGWVWRDEGRRARAGA